MARRLQARQASSRLTTAPGALRAQPSCNPCRRFQLRPESPPPGNDPDQILSRQHVQRPGHGAASHAVMTREVSDRRQRLPACPLPSEDPPPQVSLDSHTRQLWRSRHQPMIGPADYAAHAEHSDSCVYAVFPSYTVYRDGRPSRIRSWPACIPLPVGSRR